MISVHSGVISKKWLQMVRKPLVFPLFPTRDPAVPGTLIRPVEMDCFEMLKLKEIFWKLDYVHIQYHSLEKLAIFSAKLF